MALAFLDLDFGDAARQLVQAQGDDPLTGIQRDWSWMLALSYLAEVSARLGNVSWSGELYSALAPFAGRNATLTGAYFWGPVDLSLGRLASTLGDWAHAEAHFEAALEQTRAMGAVVVTAETRCAYAQMLARRCESLDLAGELVESAAAVAKRLNLRRLGVATRTARRAGTARRTRPGPALARQASCRPARSARLEAGGSGAARGSPRRPDGFAAR